MYKGEFTMKIAVCDDDRQVLLSVLSQLASYQEQRQTELSSQGFENAVDLLASIEHQNYDLLFLDVLMPGLNGLQAAREIRQKNDRIKIVFLTSSPEYAVESYSVQATNYLLKPASSSPVRHLLLGSGIQNFHTLFETGKNPETVVVSGFSVLASILSAQHGSLHRKRYHWIF